MIEGDGVELLPETKRKPGKAFWTPVGAAWLVVAAAFANLFFRKNWPDRVFLAVQTFLGLFFAYVVCVNLTAYRWNWLIIPFNILPAVFWKWRGKWGYDSTEIVYGKDGVTPLGVRAVFRTDDTSLPAGTGFWYLNLSKESKNIKW